MNDSENTASLNTHWASLLVEELVRCGLDLFCIAPGSRSTPLVAAVAAHPKAKAVVHFDERGAAFFALGYARAAGRPAAWLTTSGTAVANGLPAVVEASLDAVPMLLLTADRPPELRRTGANQTIDQHGIFNDYVRWTFDVPPPTGIIDPAFILTTVDQAVYQATRWPPGPVHLNLMFREPFVPQEPATPVEESDSLTVWRSGEGPYTRYVRSRPQIDEDEAARLWGRLRKARRGLLVVGKLNAPNQVVSVRQLAECLGWPLLADVTSGLRVGDVDGAHFYDQLLADPAFLHETPDAIVHLGGRPTSKRLLQYIARARSAPYVVVQEQPGRYDPSHQGTERVEADIAGFCQTLCVQVERSPSQTDRQWAAKWRDGSAEIGRRVDAFFQEKQDLSEPFVNRHVMREASAGSGLVLASSMPVRDVDTFGGSRGTFLHIAANRGASGIDGLIATAAGFAEGLHAPVTLLIGDLALLHDLNSLALLRERPVVVVLLNNDGGGIFHFLPIARHEAVFEPYFGTPHGFSFEAAALLFGLPYAQPTTVKAFVEAYRAAGASHSASVIEVRTDRRENHALHQELLRLATG